MRERVDVVLTGGLAVATGLVLAEPLGAFLKYALYAVWKVVSIAGNAL